MVISATLHAPKATLRYGAALRAERLLLVGSLLVARENILHTLEGTRTIVQK